MSEAMATARAQLGPWWSGLDQFTKTCWRSCTTRTPTGC